MPDYTIKGSSTVEFGTSAAGGLGTVVSATKKLGGEIRKLKNRNGKTYVKIYFDEENQCEFKAIFDTSLTIPARGAAVDIAGLDDCLVDEVEHNWENEQERMLTIRATKNDGIAS